MLSRMQVNVAESWKRVRAMDAEVPDSKQAEAILQVGL